MPELGQPVRDSATPCAADGEGDGDCWTCSPGHGRVVVGLPPGPAALLRPTRATTVASGTQQRDADGTRVTQHGERRAPGTSTRCPPHGGPAPPAGAAEQGQSAPARAKVLPPGVCPGVTLKWLKLILQGTQQLTWTGACMCRHRAACWHSVLITTPR